MCASPLSLHTSIGAFSFPQYRCFTNSLPLIHLSSPAAIYSFFLPPYCSRSHIADKFQFDTISTVVFYNAIWINTKRANACALVHLLACLLARLLALSLISFTSPLNISIVTILMTKHFARSEQLKQLNRQAYSHARTHAQTHVYTFMIFYFHTVAREHITTIITTTSSAAAAAAKRNRD